MRVTLKTRGGLLAGGYTELHSMPIPDELGARLKSALSVSLPKGSSIVPDASVHEVVLDEDGVPESHVFDEATADADLLDVIDDLRALGRTR